ncbi:hypothetical protein QO010_000799 [Caulobacter ginsengisoli]|uniref:Zinc/iron-chelating domain-containing protein n=1 Tax=Caulobacter ginsengisoli TaxID=400775 RepID=A0ABU0INR3_9CAUL|nr:YkgJ family cysteine cluster protein [Caulobacter ginsengisoli]MDQ0463051.1 hypothetical protein [Caulobacter ginsengisoli]
MKVCGTCSLCCKLLEIPALEKPAGAWCRHVVKGRGCAIHGAHPQSCRVFTCGWLARDDLGEAWKPEKARFLLRNELDLGQLCIDVDPGFPAAWRGPAYYPTIKAMARMVWDQSGCVVVFVGEKATVVFPEEDIEIGPFGGGQRLMVGYRAVDGIKRPMVRLLDGEAVAREWLGTVACQRP